MCIRDSSFPGVSQPHHLPTRRIGSYYAIEIHVRMDGKITLEEAQDVYKRQININTEMNYWPAETTGLPECS